jgi:hypothetical protein
MKEETRITDSSIDVISNSEITIATSFRPLRNYSSPIGAVDIACNDLITQGYYYHGLDTKLDVSMDVILLAIEQTCLFCWACLEKDPDCAKYFTYGVNNTLKSLLTSDDNVKYTLGVNLWKKLNPIN